MKMVFPIIEDVMNSLQNTTFPQMADTLHSLSSLQATLATDFQGHAGTTYQEAAAGPFKQKLQAYNDAVIQLQGAIALAAANLNHTDVTNGKRFLGAV